MPFRKEHLEKLKEVLLENDGKIGAALMSDLGKSSVEAYMCETGMVLSELSHATRHIRSYSRRRRCPLPSPSSRPGASSFRSHTAMYW